MTAADTTATAAGFPWEEWLMSPGFGGTAAVLAALVAFAGVSRTVKAQREANRKQQWWERARWALDLTLAADTTTRTIGLEVLDALSRSEYAGKHEFDVVDAAVAPTLEAYRDQTGEHYEEDGADADREAHLPTATSEPDGGA